MGWRLGSYVVGRLQGGHNANVTGIVVSSGRTCVSSCLDSSIVFWNLENGTVITKKIAHEGGVGCLSESQDGFMLASGGADKTVCVWDRHAGTCFASITVNNLVYSVFVSRKSNDDRVYVFAGLGNGQIHAYSLDCAVLGDIREDNVSLVSGKKPYKKPVAEDNKPYKLVRVMSGHMSAVACLACDSSER